MRGLFVIAVLASVVGCESPRKSDQAPVASTQVAESELSALVTQAQRLRDREFKSPLKVAGVDKLEPNFDVASDAARIDREWLLKTLFGFDTTSAERMPWLPRVAHYDSQTHTLSYLRSARPEDLRRDVVLAVVDGVDREAFSVPAQPSSWDGWLAHRAKTTGDAAFVWTLVEGEKLGLTPPVLAATPALAMKFPDVARFLEVDGAKGIELLNRRELSFAIREGLAFSAALHRSGGWSASELAWISGPTQAGHLVRPDRWMTGENLGTWPWPETKRPKSAELAHEGIVGPGVFSLWLSDVIAPALARAIYVTWQSDSYRIYESDGAWWFEYVSFWRTPDDAQQIAEVLDAGLRARPDADFTVLKNGAAVSVVGATKGFGASDLRLAAASLLSALKPAFDAIEKPPLSFIPTLTDAYTSGVMASKLDVENLKWTDGAAHLKLDLDPLEGWKVQKAENFVARVIATKGSATILISTEPEDPLGPSFESDEFKSTIIDNFKRTLSQGELMDATRVETPLPSTLHARLSGRVNQDVILAFWMAHNDRVIVTFSVKALPDEFDAAYATAESIWKTADFEPGPSTADEADGIIKFQVDP